MKTCPTGQTKQRANRSTFKQPPKRLMFWLVIYLFCAVPSCRLLVENDSNNSSANQNANIAAATPEDIAEKIPVVQLDPKTDRAMRKDITNLLDAWKTSIEKRNLKTYLQSYADELENFYLQRNVDKDFIRAENERVFGGFDTIRLQLKNIDIKPTAADAATVILDKEWDFAGERRRSTGAVQQVFKFRKINRRWLIVGERDWRVYRSDNQKLQSETNASQ